MSADLHFVALRCDSALCLWEVLIEVPGTQFWPGYCPKCGANKWNFLEVRTMSADEAIDEVVRIASSVLDAPIVAVRSGNGNRNRRGQHDKEKNKEEEGNEAADFSAEETITDNPER